MEFQSFLNAGIAKTPRVSSCAGAAGLGSELINLDLFDFFQ
jgi:hypothetical protein